MPNYKVKATYQLRVKATDKEDAEIEAVVRITEGKAPYPAVEVA